MTSEQASEGGAVEVTRDGPYRVTGRVVVCDVDGQVTERRATGRCTCAAAGARAPRPSATPPTG